jgi:TRAP-type C4-dicarboxylate transport system substrate-binding protein
MSRTSLLCALAGIVSLAVPLAAPRPAHADTTFKIATLAPDGSSWMKLFREWSASVEKRTEGRVKIRFFAGGSQGDEKDAVRKMRLGQLNGAAVTGVGLGLLNSEVRLLELPGLIRSDAELDHLRTTLDTDFRAKFNEKGYELLVWGDVGWVYLFSNTPVTSKAELAKTKMWVWVDDPVVRALFGQLGVQGVPLGVPDVLPSLQTGLIDAAYGSPLSTVALQWHSKVKYMTERPPALGTGATVVTRKDFDKLSPEDQKVLHEESKVLQQKLLDTIRRDNDRALAKMKSLGLTLVPSPPEFQEELRKANEAVWAELVDKMYPAAWLERVKGILAQYRGTQK